MNTKMLKLSFFSLCLMMASLGRSASELRGVSPEDDKYFKSVSSTGTIKCKDGSNKFTLSQLNDDFCDCPDGTDEPGTSACPSGKFYCRNAGHAPISIFSSRVNDGVCDCCDGSDEYDGQTKCRNTCWEAGKVARDRLKKKIATYQEGVTLRKREIEQAKVAVVNDEAELSRLKNDEKVLKGLVQQLKDRKEQIEKAEEKERLQKEKEEKEKKEAEEAAAKETIAEKKAEFAEEPVKSTTYDDRIGLLQDSPSDQDGMEDRADSEVTAVDIDDTGDDGSTSNGVREHASKKEEASSDADLDTGSKADDGSADTGSLSREELGRMVGSRWTGKKAEQQSAEADADKDDGHENYDETPKEEQEDEYNGYDSETEDDHPSYDDDDTEDHTEDFRDEDHGDSSSSYKYDADDELDLSDITSTSNPTWLEKIQQTVRNILQAVNLFQTPVDKSEAAHVRKEYDESSAKLSKIQSRISSLSQKLKHDFGPEKEFYSFYGQCFETKQNKYVYKVCPFKQATQVEGHSTTRLGNWEKFEESYRIMHFSSGDKCWNGPDRSLKVRLRCGLKNELTDVDEPSRCEYVALLSTPAICLEEKLKELEGKLDSMNKEQPQGHDEL